MRTYDFQVGFLWVSPKLKYLGFFRIVWVMALSKRAISLGSLAAK